MDESASTADGAASPELIPALPDAVLSALASAQTVTAYASEAVALLKRGLRRGGVDVTTCAAEARELLVESAKACQAAVETSRKCLSAAKAWG